MENIQGGETMENVVTQLNTSLSAANIWAVIGNVMPFAVTLTLVGLGFYLINKYLRKARHLKN